MPSQPTSNTNSKPQPLGLKLSKETGCVSGQLRLPDRSTHVIVFAHGAGAGMLHSNIQRIADALAEENLATLIFNFPFIEAGRKRVDQQAVSIAAITRALAEAERRVPDLPLLLGGHSYGGRMASHSVLHDNLNQVQALVFCSFPLHPSGKPDISRAAHLQQISQPMLFLSGTRDKLAQADLLQSVIEALGKKAELHWLDTADHGYRVLKRTRTQERDVFTEIAATTAEFCRTL